MGNNPIRIKLSNFPRQSWRYLLVCIRFACIVCQILIPRDERSGLKQPSIEITNEQVCQELEVWFNNEECEALAREAGFIQRSTSRLTGSGFFNLLTAADH
jgi:hypothetical protein